MMQDFVATPFAACFLIQPAPAGTASLPFISTNCQKLSISPFARLAYLYHSAN